MVAQSQYSTDEKASQESPISKEQAMQRALDDLLTHKKQPSHDDLNALSGEMPTIVNALSEALQEGGEIGARKSFTALCRQHPWLVELRNKTVPPRPGTETSTETPEEQKPKRRIRFVDDDVIENMPVRQWLIPAILPQNGVAMLYGPPGTYKSFLAIDWALCIGYGYGWLGRAVKQGGVAYIAGEGAFGLGARTKSWKAYHGKQGKSGVRWYDEPIPLTEPASVAELMTALDEDFPEPPKLIIIDTLSRNSGGADENSNTEMAKIIHSADLLQQKYGCSILIIHHVGKDKQKGPRGASALVGNMETIISTDSTDDGVKVECYKQKDAAPFDPIRLKLHPVQYGQLPEESSVVLVETDAPIEEGNTNKVSSKKSVQLMYELLQGKELTLSDWVALGVSKGISEPTAKRARKELYDNREVWYKKDGKLYYIPVDKDNNTCSAERDDSNE